MLLSLSSLDLIICAIVVVASVATGLTIAIRKRSGEIELRFFLAGRARTGRSSAHRYLPLTSGRNTWSAFLATPTVTACAPVPSTTDLHLPRHRLRILFPYYLRRPGIYHPEFLEFRFNRTARVFFSGLMLVICIMTKLAFHLYAGALVLHGLFGWNR